MTSLPGEYADALGRAAEVGIRLDADEAEAVLALARTAPRHRAPVRPPGDVPGGKYVLARTRTGVPEAEALAEAVALVEDLLPPPA